MQFGFEDSTMEINKEDSLKKQYLVYLALFPVLFMAGFIGMCRENTLHLLSDNIGDLASPTYLAGLDWSVVIGRSNYYGYGFKWLYFILFKLTDNPAVIYFSIYIIQYAIMALVSVCLYKIIVEKYRGGKHSFLLALTFVWAITEASVSTDSEGSVYFSFMILIILILKGVGLPSGKKKLLFSVLMAFWLPYMITLHERCLAVIIAFFIVAVIDLIISHKCIVTPWVFIPAFAGFYYAEEKFTDKVMKTLWAAKYAAGKLNNTTVSIKNPLWFLQSLSNFKVFVDTFISNVLTAITKTYGLWLLGLLLFIIGFFMLIFRNKKFTEWYKDNRVLAVAYMLCYMTALIILAGVAQRWGRGIVNPGSRGAGYYYKGMTYVRYYKPFLYVGIILSFEIYTKFPEIKKFVRAICVLLLTGFYAYFVLGLFPAMQAGRDDSFDRFGFINREIISPIVTVYLCIGVVLFVGCCFIFIKDKWLKILVPIGLIMACIYSMDVRSISKPTMICNFDGVADEMSVLSGTIDLDEYPVYYYKASKSSHNSEHTLQFMLPRIPVQFGWPDEGTENVIVISGRNTEGLLEKEIIDAPIPCIYEDDLFSVFVLGNELTDEMEAQGIEFIN